MVWEDAPSHVCRGGDKRALTFCCPPVKPCPIMNALKDAGLSPQEYAQIKIDFGKRTRLGEGEGTCFGSLIWCCKSSKPCPIRNMVMRNINMSEDEYLTLKKQLSEELVGAGSNDHSKENIKALSEAFDLSEMEAENVLKDCDNDLKTAIKILRVKKLEEMT